MNSVSHRVYVLLYLASFVRFISGGVFDCGLFIFIVFTGVWYLLNEYTTTVNSSVFLSVDIALFPVFGFYK